MWILIPSDFVPNELHWQYKQRNYMFVPDTSQGKSSRDWMSAIQHIYWSHTDRVARVRNPLQAAFSYNFQANSRGRRGYQ
jgi:hypothetical protein